MERREAPSVKRSSYHIESSDPDKTTMVQDGPDDATVGPYEAACTSFIGSNTVASPDETGTHHEARTKALTKRGYGPRTTMA